MLAETPFDQAGTAQHIAFAAQLALGAVFVASSVPKIRDPRDFARTVAQYDVVGPRSARLVAPAVIAIEVLIAVALLTGALIVVALPVAAATVLGFLAVTTKNLRRGKKVPCGCFGDPTEQISARTLGRLVALLAIVAALGFVFAADWASATTISDLAAEGASSLGYLVDAAGIAALFLLIGWWTYNFAELKPVLGALGPLRRENAPSATDGRT